MQAAAKHDKKKVQSATKVSMLEEDTFDPNTMCVICGKARHINQHLDNQNRYPETKNIITGRHSGERMQ